MKAALDCNIVRDMLPLYAEKLISEESNTAIQQHLEQCEDCRKYLENIQKPVDCPTVPKMEIDYMRKIKRSIKRRTYILAGVITASCIVLLGIFLRFFIIGSPIFTEDGPINFEWNYDADSKIYSIHGNIGRADTSARIKVYEDKRNNQLKIKIYELMPSIFFPSNEFSAKIPWNGETNIVWQGKYEQLNITNSQYMSLYIFEFKDGNYQPVVNIFDMDGTAMLKRLYDNAPDASSEELMPFDGTKYNHYLIIRLPLTRGEFLYSTDDEILPEETLDDRIFLYQEDGQYYFHKQGHHLKKLVTEDVNKILDYIKQNEVD